MNRDYAYIRKHCVQVARKLLDDFEQKRKGICLEVAHEFYPLGVSGLSKTVEELADECVYDEDHRFLNARPLDALKKGACGFHGNLTSPARRWFRLRVPSFVDEGRVNHEHRAMLDRLTDAVDGVMRGSDLYPSLYKLYEHTLCFGFGCMLVTGDSRKVIKARTLRVGTYALGVGEDGQICRVARRFSWTAEQIIREFGDAGVKEVVRDAAKRGDAKSRWTVYNLIEPNMVGDFKAYDKVAQELGLDDEMVYRSVYWLQDSCEADPQSGILEVSGFTIKPIIAPRLDYELGDTYGRGRGMDALSLARGVQSFQYDIYNISGVKGKQPVIVSTEFKDEGFHAGRAGVNYARFGEGRNVMAMPVFPNLPDSSDIRIDRQDVENQISDLFFNSSFATIDALKNNKGVKTATEIDALVRENMERLNPVVTNFDRELLDPLVSVVTKYTLASGICPLTPEDMSVMGRVNIEYISQIHVAAKQSQISAIQNWLGVVGSMAQAKPNILDKVDEDGLADELADLYGVPESVCADDEKIAMVRQARERAAEQSQKVQMMAALGKAAGSLGGVPTDDGHMGGAILKGLGGE